MKATRGSDAPDQQVSVTVPEASAGASKVPTMLMLQVVEARALSEYVPGCRVPLVPALLPGVI